MKGKKGFIGDLLIYGIMIFILAVVILIAFMVLSKVNIGFQSLTGDTTTNGKQILSDNTNRYVKVQDAMFLGCTIGFMIALMILAWALSSHPVFAMISFVMLIIITSVGIHLANAYYSFSSDSNMSAYASQFTFIPLVMGRLPIFILMAGVVFFIVLYSKPSGGINL